MRNRIVATAAAVAALGGVALGPITAQADDVADFYSGKQITMLISFGAGGGYDLYARTVMTHLVNHIPGKPSYVMQYMPGAGGARAAAYFQNVAPKNGTVIGMMANGAPLGQLLRENVKYDAASFNYLGRVASMESGLIVWHTAKAKTFEDWKSHTVIFGATGTANQDYYVPQVAAAILGTKVKMVQGYKGSSAINKAMEQGEVEAMSQSWASVKSRRGAWLRENKIRTLAINGLKRPPDGPDAPLLIDLAKTDEDRRALELIASAAAVGRAFSVTPGAPADRIAALRAAFEATMRDPAFLADAKARKLDLNPLSGEEIQEIVNRTIQAPKPVVARIKSLM